MARNRAEPSLLLGPVLYFRGEQRDRWWLSALFVLDGEVEPDDLRVDGVTLPVPPRHVTVWRRRHLWRFDFAVPRGVQDTDASYGFADGPSWSLVVPGRFSRPRIAFVCGGGLTPPPSQASQKDSAPPASSLWPDLLRQHDQDRYHLLVQGGGQIDGEAVLAASPLMSAWRTGTAATRAAQPFSPALAEELMDAAIDQHLRQWRRAEVAEALARIPSVMMWDDADIADGWGTGTDSEATSKVMRGVFMTARRNYALFQLGALAESPPDCVWGAPRATMTQGFHLGNVGLLALDLRSERTRRRVLSDRSWALLPDWLARFEDSRHLIVMTGTPLLIPATAGLERVTGWIPGLTDLTKRLGDQWRSRSHVAEWERLIGALGDFSRRSGCRVTVLSNGAGVGARGVLRGEGVELWQVLAPSLTSPPPTGLRRFATERLAAQREQPLPGHWLDMPRFRDSGQRTIARRGWVTLALDEKDQLHARWFAEADSRRYEQAI
ncbi:alkaline phosphatase family protein [Azospirillum griseum]|uniref:Alkaline phosphatase family protein n=1 Tax=Azospirillum griseum TaxID=2496639 RepID=A0A3S0HZX7_9PROT|nr:alkaline phosphatase family protein [Azospirillum griseum]RTR23530.1 alkaline phosphatase family protein [Azospirillum griseum]